MRTFVAGLLAACLLGSVASAADQPLPGSPDAKLSAQIKKEADRQEAQQKGTSELKALFSHDQVVQVVQPTPAAPAAAATPAASVDPLTATEVKAPAALPPLKAGELVRFANTTLLPPATTSDCEVLRNVESAGVDELSVFTLMLKEDGSAFSGPVIVEVWMEADKARTWKTSGICATNVLVRFSLWAVDGVIVVPYVRDGNRDVQFLVGGNRFSMIADGDKNQFQVRNDP